MKKSGHEDIDSAIYLCKNINSDALHIIEVLRSNDLESLPTWWTNKLAICYAYINSLNDYIVYAEQEETHDNEEEDDAVEEEDFVFQNISDND